VETLLDPILTGVGVLFFLALGGFALSSLRERERRAATLSVIFTLAGGLFFLWATRFPASVKFILLVFIGGSFAVFLILFTLPIGVVEIGQDTPTTRVDERDIMFARNRLVPGSPEYRAYYAMRPESEKPDAQTRAKPGLLSPDAKLYDPFHFASAVGSFHLTEALREAVTGPVGEEGRSLPPGEMTAYLKGLARFFGALDVSITELKPYHVYSNIGRGPGRWGDPIHLAHSRAIAFTVEMSHPMIGANPAPLGVMESAKQYVEAARVAVPLAAAIRCLGYDARAHIDGSYQVICPLVACDAGLGEIGRMGLLMTPGYGPRVRLGVVTTDLPLIPDGRKPAPSVIDFCNICKKCADNCPSKAIPFDDRQEIDGALRWKLDANACFRYWNVIGTDCGICMKVCPYSHPYTAYHNLTRWGIARSGFFRRVALRLDDLFYGVEPAPRTPPTWTLISK
jgi:ferredoxin